MKHKTNIEQVVHFMEYTALGQLFVMDALDRLSTSIVNNEQELRASWPEDHLISIDSWINAAHQWKERTTTNNDHNE